MIVDDQFQSRVQKSIKLLMERDPVIIQYDDINDLSLNSNINDERIKNEVVKGANIYALWVRGKSCSEWTPMYVGQRTESKIIERIKQHLFKKPKQTQSKLSKVENVVSKGSSIGITTIHVSPDPLRLSIEDQIIYQNTPTGKVLPWNNKSRNKPLVRT
ncbi:MULTISPECIES: hypothetical protein [Aliivibrio]|uniref:GIY-YIG nuclease family protein n=1 Tax=Aliivibrio finisterrensis TaxID=511998 RepID=A0A4Q5KKH3_9GAMM|nr:MULTISPECIES: hypothetical protein [Aliivibrio]MDD9180781.1 hypothetical protein [Aliivibrio sp. A6]RYU46047.1 hypothetical protein ERW57_19505 [Aliivibrio finisterrensis]RYU46285.1 hypothetical protein ERW56_19730 [Aliivibrio finisterrensis]RYU50401.1 hypothetical protein ERW50_19865 [Aliivibrio finisterrensis]RYU58737.1 hypothetical protein ERW53_20380 [Aliivibrio finisterrensis]